MSSTAHRPPAGLPLDEHGASSVLRDDGAARLELVSSKQGVRLRKTYFARGVRALPTLLGWSRARREFENLVSLNAAGVPCARSMTWREDRVFGLVRASSVEIDWVRGTTDLRTILRGDPAVERRRLLAEAYGDLLRQLHRSGLCSTAASPRHVLVRGDADLLVRDQQHLLAARGVNVSGQMADIDLFDAFFSPSRAREWSLRDRYLGLRAYCGGDRRETGRLWRRLARRTQRMQWGQKRIARALQRCPGFLRAWAVVETERAA